MTMTLMENLWREFKETTLEELKLLMLNIITQAGTAVKDALTIVDGMRVAKRAGQVFIWIQGVSLDLVQAALCTTGLSECHGQCQVSETRSGSISMRFNLPVPSDDTDASWLYRYIPDPQLAEDIQLTEDATAA